ncbi:MAG: hypothetical protein HFI34_02120 [Lachnospiraceae bacterium]|nr:hypothetical protein [Lachnospiraceae bacterium]
MEKYIVMGYEFDNKASAEAAKNELEMISKIKSQGNMNNHKIALSVYNKLLEENLFKTPVGLEYIRSLQKELLSVKNIDKSEIKAIKINNEKSSEQQPVKKITEFQKNTDKNKKDAQKYKDRFTKSLIANIVFVIIIAAMFLIVKYTHRFDDQAHRERIENEYISWENDLKERESYIQQWELEHGRNQ